MFTHIQELQDLRVRNETHQRDYQSVLCEFALETVVFRLILL